MTEENYDSSNKGIMVGTAIAYTGLIITLGSMAYDIAVNGAPFDSKPGLLGTAAGMATVIVGTVKAGYHSVELCLRKRAADLSALLEQNH